MTSLLKHSSFDCVPKHCPANLLQVEQLSKFISNCSWLMVVTGAGVSTESGIPDYRSEGVGMYHRNRLKPYRPIQHIEFVTDYNVRQRYWLKNFIGWANFSAKQPNITHFTLKHLENSGLLKCIVTQNVDSLHFKAESKNVIELHGSAFRVRCLDCGENFERMQFQNLLRKINPDVLIESYVPNPDGDVDIDEGQISNFSVPNCNNCGGILQPDIVFFGGNVPKERHQAVEENVDKCDSLLILGSSLTVFSSYRIVLKAFEKNKPIAIVNIGQTRGDHLAHLKIDGRCGEILPLACRNII